MGEQKQKKVHFEVMRIIAIFGVLFCHTGVYGVSHYLEANNGVNYWLGIFLASVAQFCVPLFLMISGGVLLNREESIGYVYRHRVLKMVLATLLATLIQYQWNRYKNPLMPPLNLNYFFRFSYEGSVSSQNWFLYSYISFLLLLPFLQRLVKVLTEKAWFLYIFGIWVVFNGVFPVLEYYQEWNRTELALSVHSFIIYSMLGYYLEHRCGESFYRKKNMLIVLGGTVLIALVNMWLNHDSLQKYNAIKFGSAYALVYAAAVFVLIKYICQRWKMPSVMEKVFCFAGAGVFGTYIIEETLRDIFFPIYLYLNTRIFSYPAVFVWIAVCVLVGVSATSLLKRIPGISKVIP